MASDVVEQAVAKAVGQAYAAWAAEHPSLASVIDQVELAAQAAESLRASDEYKQAVAGYYRSQSEFELLNRLLDLAGPIVLGLLAA